MLLSEQQRNCQGNNTFFLVAEKNHQRALIDNYKKNWEHYNVSLALIHSFLTLSCTKSTDATLPVHSALLIHALLNEQLLRFVGKLQLQSGSPRSRQWELGIQWGCSLLLALSACLKRTGLEWLSSLKENAPKFLATLFFIWWRRLPEVEDRELTLRNSAYRFAALEAPGSISHQAESSSHWYLL